MAANLRSSRPRVLCVDDEPHVLRALTWLLGRQFDICIATNAADALQLVQRNDYDVVISDQRMPGVTGVEFLREVRRCAPRAMRILLTGYADLDAIVSSANESEVFRFVTKPWNVQELSNLVGEAAAIARSAPVEEAAPDHADPQPGAAVSAKVLLVDDSEEVAASVREELRGTAEVVHATDLAQALAMLDEEALGVIITEMRVGGLDATRFVRVAKQKRPEIVSLAFSDTRDAEQVMSLINEGQVFRLIPKPVKEGFIRLVVEAALRRHWNLRREPELGKRYSVAPAPEGVEELAREVAASMAAAADAAGRARPPAVARLLRWLLGK